MTPPKDFCLDSGPSVPMPLLPPSPMLSDALQVYHPHAAGIDIGEAEHWVAVPPGCAPICIKVGYLPHHHDFRPRERPPYRTHSPQVIGDSSGVFFFVCTIPSVELA